MGMKCTVCRHSAVADIDRALIDGRPLRNIAEQYGMSPQALLRHQADHISEALLKAKDVEKVAHADTVLDHSVMLRDRALNILDMAERENDLRTALAAIREARECVRLLGELAGKLQSAGTVNVIMSAEWIQVQAVILSALEPFPDARLAVAHKLEAIEP
jgi:hypothetical protein